MKRRSFISLGTVGGLGVLAGATALYSWQIEPFWLEFVHLKMPIKNLPQHLVGKTIMQISDIHIGEKVDSQFIKKSFGLAQKYNPDFVVYTGDFVSFENNEQYEQLNDVFEHAVKGKYGTIGILGNHDYGEDWSDAAIANNVVSILADKGVEVLRNEQKTIEGISFTGMDDWWGRNYNPRKALRKIDNNAPNIVLCHNPDVVDLPVWKNYNYDGWILSGHTHGGQCKPPFLKPPILPVRNKNYTAGKFDLKDGRKLYINRALGYVLQVRFNVRPEITIFELEKAV